MKMNEAKPFNVPADPAALGTSVSDTFCKYFSACIDGAKEQCFSLPLSKEEIAG